jgi:hypothetical protein
MKRLVLASMLLEIAVSPALADWIGVFDDPAGLDCEATDVTAGIKFVYVVHQTFAGATGLEFRVDADQTTFSYVSTQIGVGFVSFGEANTGISIAYNECVTGTFVACRVGYDVLGTTAPCAHVILVENPWGVPPVRIYTDCVGDPKPFVGGQLIVNANESCRCDIDAVEPATWGSIKALYR